MGIWRIRRFLSLSLSLSPFVFKFSETRKYDMNRKEQALACDTKALVVEAVRLLKAGYILSSRISVGCGGWRALKLTRH